MATYNFLDKTGLGQVWAKIKALIVQSDWEEDDTTDSAFIQNKPSIIAGEGESSIKEGVLTDGSQKATYTIYVTGEANARTFSFTTEDTLPSSLNTNRIFVEFDGSLNSTLKYQRPNSIDLTNHTITVPRALNSSAAVSNLKATIYRQHHLAIGKGSHVEGMYNVAVSAYGHVEGSYGFASGASHVEGVGCSASAEYDHAEGNNVRVDGSYSHGEGWGTIVGRLAQYQHVQGKYNIEDTQIGKYAHIVGNGTSDNARSNAHTLDWSGNAWYAGKVTAGAAPTNDMDLATKQYVDNAIPTVPTKTVVNFDISNPSSITADKTFSEVSTAITNGDEVVAHTVMGVADNILPLAYYSQYQIGFVYSTIDATQQVGIVYKITMSSSGDIAYTYRIIPEDLGDLSDTTISLPSDGQILKYDSTSSKWINANEVTVPTPSSTTPSADGTGSAGSSTNYARADHVHPKITQALSMSSNVITLTGSDGTTSSVTLPVYNGGVVTPS